MNLLSLGQNKETKVDEKDLEAGHDLRTRKEELLSSQRFRLKMLPSLTFNNLRMQN